MNKDARFDHIVGLIYESAHSAQGPDSIIDAISCEIDTISGVSVGSNSKREWVRDVVFRAVSPDLGAAHFDRGPSSSLHDAMKVPSQASSGHDGEAARLLHRLTTHLQRSVGMRQRMRNLEEQQAIGAVDLRAVPFGLAWVGHDLKVVKVNARGDDILKMQDGLALRNGRLWTRVAADLERLESALQMAMRADDPKARLLAIRRRTDTLPLLATVIPAFMALNNPPLPMGPQALVILQNHERNSFDLDHLQLVYGFTAAERALGEALLRNETVDSFALHAGVSRSTVRTHLAKLFAKTGTSRQAELVRLLMLARPMS